MDFESHHNVKAVKGFVMKNVSVQSKATINAKAIKISLNGIILKEKDKLIDLKCGTTPLIVTF